VATFAGGDKFHAQGLAAVRNLQAGKRGKVFTTDFVVAETLNYLVARARDPTLPNRVASELLGESGSPWVKVLPVDASTWQAARQKFRGLSKAGLSFTDCTSLAVIDRLGLQGIVSFDSGFDGHVSRFTD
jgi:predicted nucleic acid-binding protein